MNGDRRDEMRQRAAAFLLALVLLACCAGCAMFEKEYRYAEPFVGSLDGNTGDATEVRNYNMLKAAILDMINSRQETAEFRFSNYNGAVSDDLAAVSLEIKSQNPLGAYAVDTLSYDTSRIVSYYIAEVNISYKRSAEQIKSIRSVNSVNELKTYLHDEILMKSLPVATIRPYVSKMDAAALEKLLERICLEDPVGIPLPVTEQIEGFPKEGSSSIFEIRLSYKLPATVRSSLSQQISGQIRQMTEEALPQRPEQQALVLAERLSESLTEPLGEYSGTAYGALVHHGADSRGIALAYSALCRASGIECTVVKGSIGAMGTEEHYWNIIGIDDAYYHVDVSQFIFAPGYAFLISDDDLWGTYIWNTEDYPVCDGALHYADVAPQPEREEAPKDEKPPVSGEEAPQPGETEQPAPPEQTPEAAGEIIP